MASAKQKSIEDSKPDKQVDGVTEFLSDAEEIEHRPLPWYARVTLYLLAAFLLVFILWASLSDIDRVVVAKGELVTTSATMVVQPLTTSVIRSIDVKVGQVVKEGQVLSRLDPTFASADLTRLTKEVNTLSARISRLEVELDGGEVAADYGDDAEEQIQLRLFNERLDNYKAQLRYYEQEKMRIQAAINSNLDDQNILRQRLVSAREIEQMRQKLKEEGSGSKLNLLESKDQRLAIENALQTAINKASELKHEYSSASARYDVFRRDWRQKALEELATAKKEYEDAAEQLSKAKRLNELVELKAPADAVVLEVAELSIGSVLREAEPLITLVPLDAPLEARVRINSKDIGFVRIGDHARVKLDAFPYQKYGWVDAKVRLISEDTFARTDSENANSDNNENVGAYYRAWLEPVETKLTGMTENIRLLPGMTLSAEVVVGERRVITYFLYPVIRSLDSSFREP